jgi:N-acetylglutamate synthase-like GNAT family acetyltransferase
MTHPYDYSIRPAMRPDLKTIHRLIRKNRLNFLGLEWRRFYVAVDCREGVIGCGQIKVHSDGSRELASLVVEENWQGRGVARELIRHLIQSQKEELWLMCRSALVPFYEKFGFLEIIEPLDMPPYFRRIKRLWLIVVKVIRRQQRLSVMLRQNVATRFHDGTQDM